MGIDPKHVAAIRRTLTQEVLNAAGLPRQWWGKQILDAMLWLPTRRFAYQMAQFDLDVASLGVVEASRVLLDSFVEGVGFWGRDNIPQEGPVLLACNHPGAYDSFAVVSGLPRDDLCVIASGVDFTRSLPATARHLAYVTPDPMVRMTALRQSLRHLQQGGMVFIFPTGLVDPDPALWPDLARASLQAWSHSLEVFLRRAPDLQLVIAISSHMLMPSCARSPLTRLVRQDWQRRRLAEYLQVFLQLETGFRFGLTPRVSFSIVGSAVDLCRSDPSLEIQSFAAQAMQQHLSRSSTDFKKPA